MKIGALLSLAVLGCASGGEGVDDAAEPPCEDLLGTLSTPTGSKVDFCAFEDGSVAVLEHAPLSMHAYVNDLERHWRCPADLYADLAPEGAAVPVELAEDCERRTQAGVVADPVVPRPPLTPPQPAPRSHFCAGTTGDDDFIDEVCSLMEANAASSVWYDSMWWCHAVSSTETQRTASSQIGHPVDKVRAALAACGGTSNFKLKEYSGGSWSTKVDTDVLANYWVDGYLYTDLIDKDLRFNGEAYGSGWYRNAGMFGDFEWP